MCVVNVQRELRIWAGEGILSDALFHLFLISSHNAGCEFLEITQHYLIN